MAGFLLIAGIAVFGWLVTHPHPACFFWGHRWDDPHSWYPECEDCGRVGNNVPDWGA